jgi:hypothetical protein
LAARFYYYKKNAFCEFIEPTPLYQANCLAFCCPSKEGIKMLTAHHLLTCYIDILLSIIQHSQLIIHHSLFTIHHHHNAFPSSNVLIAASIAFL